MPGLWRAFEALPLEPKAWIRKALIRLVTLGIFLLLAARNPAANRSLIAFTAWSSFAHAVVMGVQAFRNMIPRGELVGVAALVVIGVALVLLSPPTRSVEQKSAAGA